MKFLGELGVTVDKFSEVDMTELRREEVLLIISKAANEGLKAIVSKRSPR